MLRITAIIVALLGLASASWEHFKSAHGKSYDRVEETFRRQLYDKNLARINAHNLRYELGATTYRMGLNPFTDMTNDEFKAFKGLRFNASNTVRIGQRFEHELVGDALPNAVDWVEKVYVTHVKNEGIRQTGWAFSATGSLEGQHFKATGKLVSLSEQNLIDCVEGNDGFGGSVDEVIMKPL